MQYLLRRAARLLAVATGLMLTWSAQAQVPRRPTPPPAPSDEQSYSKEFVFGINFNTQGGLIGGLMLRSAHLLENDRLLRFWSLEGVMLKNDKEQRYDSRYGGSFVYTKANYAFALRPSFGFERILFRKAAESGVQVNGLLSAGPSIGLLMPYHIIYDRTLANTGAYSPSTDELVNEQYDPTIHTVPGAILDSAPLFSGIGNTSVVPGAHLRGGLSFEYGRYRDAVTGVEAGFLLEAYTRRMLILNPDAAGSTDELNYRFFPSVYLTLYFGQRT